ncbi:MAG: hypothetical protein LBR82_03190 [Desulfovibrio sp.]|nr:hypothetical protein [Desulfovibrio sp.]
MQSIFLVVQCDFRHGLRQIGVDSTFSRPLRLHSGTFGTSSRFPAASRTYRRGSPATVSRFHPVQNGIEKIFTDAWSIVAVDLEKTINNSCQAECLFNLVSHPE